MATTTNYGWPLPDPTAAPDVPYDLDQLGQAIDAEFADTGWVDVTVSGGFAAMAGAEKPQVRKIGPVVYLRGGWSNTGIAAANTTYTVGTVPSGYRPPSGCPTVGACGSSVGAAIAGLHIDTAGSVQIRTSGTLGSYYKMDRQSYTVD
jgi:hypothetical protein